jgi:uncharacterized membrane protein YhiD involved in acid resistance
MTIPLEQAAIDLAVAGGLSSLIAFERQRRNRHRTPPQWEVVFRT